ncbi:MAG TPA: hypothetical protein VHU85_08435 [Acidimicrobiales bacterium]|jgi:hypothetical protein|nr:hypothetical protein [Acidimicrobiales bacterium]
MVDLKSYWRQHEQDRRTAVDYGIQAMTQAKAGGDYAACAQFVVAMGLETELGDRLMTSIIQRVVEIMNTGEPGPTLENAAGLGEAARILTSASD